MKELEAERAADFKAFLRMEPHMYYELLNRVPVEFRPFRPSIGRCPLHRLATGTILSKGLSHIGRSSVGVR